MLTPMLGLIRAVFNRDQAITQAPFMQANLNPYGMSHQGAVSPLTEFNSQIDKSTQVNQDLISRYTDYQEMATYPELGNALSIFADEATQQDILTGKTVWFESKDQVIQNILDFTFHKQLNIEDEAWGMIRQLCHMGNLFREVVVFDQVGVVKLMKMRAENTRRVEDRFGNLFGFIGDESMNFSISTEEFLRRLYQNQEDQHSSTLSDTIRVYEPWEVAHWRFLSSGQDELYGYSILDSSRWAWKRLQMMEDAVVLAKLTRAPQRYAFYVDVGDLPPNEARKELNRIKQEFKKHKYVDPSTGKLSFRYSPLALDEDFFIARRKGSRSTEVEVLSGLDSQSVEDVQYFKDKLLSSLPMPKSYLGADETIARANLGTMDVRFAKTVLRIQKQFKQGLMHVSRVDLAARNIDPDQVDYLMKMVIPSGVLEISHIEVQKAKTELAQNYQALNFPDLWIYTKILGLTEEEALEIETMRSGGSVPSFDRDTGASEPTADEPLASSVERRLHRQKELVSSKHRELEPRILESLEKNDSMLGRRISELRGLTMELRQAMAGMRNVNSHK